MSPEQSPLGMSPWTAVRHRGLQIDMRIASFSAQDSVFAATIWNNLTTESERIGAGKTRRKSRSDRVYGAKKMRRGTGCRNALKRFEINCKNFAQAFAFRFRVC